MTGVDPKGLPQAVIERAMMFECAACTAAGIETNCYPANLSFLVGSRVLCEDCYDERGSDAVAPRVADMLPAALTPLKGAPAGTPPATKGVTDEMVEAALAAYVKSADIEANFEVHKDWLVPAIRAALFAALSLPAPGEGAQPVGWAYQDARWIDEGRWHLCLTEPRALENRIVKRVYLEDTLSPTAPELGAVHRIEHDGFEGSVIGSYTTREGKRGVVLQQIGTKVVHVYGEKWLAANEPQSDEMQPDTYTGGDFNGVVRGKKP